MQKPGGQTLFVVDDDEDLAYLMCRSLRQAMPDATIIPFTDARQCTRCLETSAQPTILITDLDMPAMDGFELIEWIRTRSALRFPLIVFSGSVFALKRDQCSRLGADAFVTKGMGFSELLTCVQDILQTGFSPLHSLKDFQNKTI